MTDRARLGGALSRERIRTVEAKADRPQPEVAPRSRASITSGLPAFAPCS